MLHKSRFISFALFMMASAVYVGGRIVLGMRLGSAWSEFIIDVAFIVAVLTLDRIFTEPSLVSPTRSMLTSGQTATLLARFQRHSPRSLRRGLEIAPDLAVGDGALGFWKAIEEAFPSTRHQRCWVHKTANVLNKVALSVQVNMKADLREIHGAPTRAAAELAINVFADKYGAKYDKAVACLTKDRETLLAFFDFPAEHWDHLRTSNPIESVFATVRHRTVRTKGALSAKTAKLMVFKLVNAAAKTWRRLKGENQLPKVVQGIKFQNGIEVIEMPVSYTHLDVYKRQVDSDTVVNPSIRRARPAAGLRPTGGWRRCSAPTTSLC